MSFSEFFAWTISALAMYANSQSYQRFGASNQVEYCGFIFSYAWIRGLFSCVMVFAGMGSVLAFPEAASHAEGFWAFVFTILPIGLRGLFVTALLAAVMSTVSADYLIASTVIMTNIIKDFLVPSITDRQSVIGTKILLWVLGGLTVVGTMFFQEGIDKAYYYVGGFQVAVFFVPLIIGLFYKKRTPAAGFWSLLCSAIFYAIWQFVLNIPFGIPSNVATLVFSFILYMAICNVTYKDNKLNAININSLK